MPLNFTAIQGILSIVIPAVQTAERFFRGSRRGAEKKEAVVRDVVETLKETHSEATDVASGQSSPGILGRMNWIQLILSAPEIADQIGDVVDAVVKLLNFVRKSENVSKGPTLVS